MTVSELILKLKKYPRDSIVLIRVDYRTDDIDNLRPIESENKVIIEN
jgi:hypothetical protein